MRRTRVLPTARGIGVAAVAAMLVALSAGTGMRAARDVAAALIVVLAVAIACASLSAVGLRVRRAVADPAVVIPGSARVDLELAPGALLRALPLATGTVRCAMPPALGGDGELELRPSMPHALPVRARGVHELGPCRIRVRDVLGMVRVDRTEDASGVIVGLPRIEPVATDLARRAGLGALAAGGPAPSGSGELGPFARPYAAGDDLRHIHWRASARTGGLMTREDEPAAAREATVVLDDRSHPETGAACEERAVSVAVSLWSMLREHGWSARILDARGDELVRGDEGAVSGAERLRAQRALAPVRFAPPTDPAGQGGSPVASGLAVVVGTGGSAERLRELVPSAGRGVPGIALAIGESGPLRRGRSDAWTLVECPVGASLDTVVAAIAEVGP